MNDYEFQYIRHTILNFFLDVRVKVKAQHSLKSSKNLSFTIIQKNIDQTLKGFGFFERKSSKLGRLVCLILRRTGFTRLRHTRNDNV